MSSGSERKKEEVPSPTKRAKKIEKDDEGRPRVPESSSGTPTATRKSPRATGEPRRDSPVSRATTGRRSQSPGSARQFFGEKIGAFRAAVGTWTEAKLSQLQAACGSPMASRRAYIFLPETFEIDREKLQILIAQFYNTMQASEPAGEPEPDPTQEAPEEVKIVLTPCSPKEGPSESLIRKLSNLPASSDSSRSPTPPKAPRERFIWSPSLFANLPVQRSSDSSDKSGTQKKGESDEKQQQRSTSGERDLHITGLLILDEAEGEIAKRRLSSERGANPEGDDTAHCSMEIDEGPAVRPRQPVLDIIEDSGKASSGTAAKSETPEPLPSHPLTAARSPSDRATSTDTLSKSCSLGPFMTKDKQSRSPRMTVQAWEVPRETDSLRGLHGSADPAPPNLRDFFRECYQTFMELYREGGRHFSHFLDDVKMCLLDKLRRPQPGYRRYIFIAGLTLWLLVRGPSGDYWFLCGGAIEDALEEVREEEGRESNPSFHASIENPHENLKWGLCWRSVPSSEESVPSSAGELVSPFKLSMLEVHGQWLRTQYAAFRGRLVELEARREVAKSPTSISFLDDAQQPEGEQPMIQLPSPPKMDPSHKSEKRDPQGSGGVQPTLQAPSPLKEVESPHESKSSYFTCRSEPQSSGLEQPTLPAPSPLKDVESPLESESSYATGRSDPQGSGLEQPTLPAPSPFKDVESPLESESSYSTGRSDQQGSRLEQPTLPAPSPFKDVESPLESESSYATGQSDPGTHE